jgi:predicted ATPase
MVKEIKIQNYKSVQNLTLELGRINVLIGANGCGKSNILEAIAFGSAAAEYKLSNEFLSSRGIRVTDPVWMRSGFNKKFSNEPILINFNVNDNILVNEISHKNTSFSEWSRNTDSKELIIAGKISDKLKLLAKKSSGLLETAKKDMSNLEIVNEELEKLLDSRIDLLEDFNNNVKSHIKLVADIGNFLIYAPENTFLRRFEEESQIEPLGIRGEGLFKLLSVMSQETPEEFQEIIENLELIDWFDGFEIPKDLVFTERRIRIKDRFLEEGLQYFDQRSSNEGFLFLMFYFALFISKYTPKFFAIDNIDASLNPKLCIELIKILTKLAKKHDKQVIFTTHNPAILDGLNLNDDEVRLLVVNRNINGHTKVKRVLKKEMPEGVEPLRLSEQFLRGYLGGLPKNF